VVVFPKEHYRVGDFVDVKINDCTSATLIGIPLRISETI
jgi:tRNA-2-methylthio-N6-dimethylallyladenosine synthase